MKNESLIVEDVHSLSIMDLLTSQHFSGDLMSIGCHEGSGVVKAFVIKFIMNSKFGKIWSVIGCKR